MTHYNPFPGVDQAMKAMTRIQRALEITTRVAFMDQLCDAHSSELAGLQGELTELTERFSALATAVAVKQAMDRAV